MPFCGLIIPAYSGENLINLLVIRLGKPSITTFDSLKSGVFGRAAGAEELLDSLIIKERKRNHREETPSLLAIDS